MEDAKPPQERKVADDCDGSVFRHWRRGAEAGSFVVFQCRENRPCRQEPQGFRVPSLVSQHGITLSGRSWSDGQADIQGEIAWQYLLSLRESDRYDAVCDVSGIQFPLIELDVSI